MTTRVSIIVAAVAAAGLLGMAFFGLAGAHSGDDGFIHSTCATAPGDLSHCE